MAFHHQNPPRSLQIAGKAPLGIASLRSAGDHGHGRGRSERGLSQMAERASQRRKIGVKAAAVVAGLLLLASWARAGEPLVPDHGTAAFVPTPSEDAVAKRFRMDRHSFSWEAHRLSAVSENFEVY